MSREDLHYLISVKLVNGNDKSKFHTVEILIGKDDLAPELFEECFYPTVESASLEICNYRVIK